MSLRSALAPYSCSLQNTRVLCLRVRDVFSPSQIYRQGKVGIKADPTRVTLSAQNHWPCTAGKSSSRKTSASFVGLELDLCFDLLPVQPGFYQAGEGKFAPLLPSFTTIQSFAVSAFCIPASSLLSCVSNCDKVAFPAVWLGAERESMNPAASLLAAPFPAEQRGPADGSPPLPD